MLEIISQETHLLAFWHFEAFFGGIEHGLDLLQYFFLRTAHLDVFLSVFGRLDE